MTKIPLNTNPALSPRNPATLQKYPGKVEQSAKSEFSILISQKIVKLKGYLFFGFFFSTLRFFCKFLVGQHS